MEDTQTAESKWGANKKTSLSVPEYLYAEFKVVAVRRNVSVGDLLVEALESVVLGPSQERKKVA